VFSSTANIYGNPAELPITEAAIAAPPNPYATSKLAAEYAITGYAVAHRSAAVSLRYFNAAGALIRPGDPAASRGERHDPETHLIPNALLVASGRRDKLALFGDDYPTPDGTCVRDYIHVCDLADAHVRVLDKLSKESCRYNLGNGKGYSVREVIEMARKVTGAKIEVRTGPRRPGDPPTLVASSDRIRQELGWKPRFADLETIVRTAWEWRRRHHNGYPD
jgi:UDP-glucose 4-epimerase